MKHMHDTSNAQTGLLHDGTPILNHSEASCTGIKHRITTYRKEERHPHTRTQRYNQCARNHTNHFLFGCFCVLHMAFCTVGAVGIAGELPDCQKSHKNIVRLK